MKNIFGPWLANLRKPLGPAPKAIPDHQFYMKHPQYKEKVAEVYRLRHPGGSAGDNAINERNKIAIEPLQNEPKDVQEALKSKAAEELKVAKSRHEEAKRGLLSDRPEDVDVYAESFPFSSSLLFL